MKRVRQFFGSRCFWLGMGALAIVVADCGELLAQEPGTVVAADKRVQGRSYVFQETGETIQFAVFVPSNYDAAKKWPLMVGLHGRGRPYDWLMGYDGIVDFAQRDGFIMVTPLGYRSLGGFGAPRLTPMEAQKTFSTFLPRPAPATPPLVRTPAQVQALERQEREEQGLPASIRELSERDVMHVLEIVRKEFNVDPNRIYLWGQSMGGGGTYHLAAKYPDIWAAIAAAAPAPAPNLDELERFKQIPVLVLQGDADQTVPPAYTRDSVSKITAVQIRRDRTRERPESLSDLRISRRAA